MLTSYFALRATKDRVVCPEFLRGDSGLFVGAVGWGGVGGLVGLFFGKGMRSKGMGTGS